MKRMMKVAALTACVGAMLCFAGCNKGDADKGVVADTKVAAQGKSAKDVATKEVLCPSAGNSPENVAVTQVKNFLKAFGSPCTCKVSKSEIKGDKGIVYIDIYDNGVKDSTQEIEVVKENGMWKVFEEDPDLDDAANAANSIACMNWEKYGSKPKLGDGASFHARVSKKEKVGENVVVSIDMFVTRDNVDSKVDSFTLKMGKVDDEWKPVGK